MNNLKFDIEWIEPEAAQGKELAATWASLRISIDENVITRVVSDAGVRERLFLPLYPLTEWLALNWWFLDSEVQNDQKYIRTDFDERHNIRHAQEGYALPNLIFNSLGKERIEVHWWADQLKLQGLRFLESGRAALSKADVFDEFQKLICTVIERLENFEITDTALQKEWEAIIETDTDEENFCRIAAMLGVNPFGITDKTEQTIIQAYEALSDDVKLEFFSVASLQKLEVQTEELNKSIEELSSVDIVNNTLVELKNKLRKKIHRTDKPWTIGYKMAQNLRKELKLNGQAIGDLGMLGELIGFKGAQLDKVVFRKANANLPVLGIAAINEYDSPAFFVNDKGIREFQRFTFCRALSDYLYGDRSVYLVTSSRNEQQKTSRAFAAEFLAPHQALNKLITFAEITPEEIEELAHQFNVSSYVIRHQVENHHLAEIVED